MTPEEKDRLDSEHIVAETVQFVIPSLEEFLKTRGGESSTVSATMCSEGGGGESSAGVADVLPAAEMPETPEIAAAQDSKRAVKAGTLPHGPARTAVMRLWRAEMGQVVRMQLLREGGKENLRNRVALRLLELFKSQAPEDIAGHYRQAGFEPPDGYDRLAMHALGSEARDHGLRAYTRAHYASEMREVWNEDKTKGHDFRKNVVKNRLQKKFYSLELDE